LSSHTQSLPATGGNLLKNKPSEPLSELRELDLSLFYVGCESGDDLMLERVNKGDRSLTHVLYVGHFLVVVFVVFNTNASFGNAVSLEQGALVAAA
jgi:hypothetical protein